MKPRIRPKFPAVAVPVADDLFPTPESLKRSAAPAARKPRGSTAKADKAPPQKVQPFLPGLSRRGRPRSKDAVPATERAAESRRRRVEAGARRVELMLPPEVAASLDALAERAGVTRAELVSRLVTRAARRALK